MFNLLLKYRQLIWYSFLMIEIKNIEKKIIIYEIKSEKPTVKTFLSCQLIIFSIYLINY